MDTNLYALEHHARTRIEDARHAAARAALLERILTPRSPRVLAGVALMRAGRWLRARTARRRDVPLELARTICAPGRPR
jgi:hypothetical protein